LRFLIRDRAGQFPRSTFYDWRQKRCGARCIGLPNGDYAFAAATSAHRSRRAKSHEQRADRSLAWR
jgi:hypothetical protein